MFVQEIKSLGSKFVPRTMVKVTIITIQTYGIFIQLMI